MRAIVVLSAGLLVASSFSHAGPARQIIPLASGEALIIPGASPVRFQRLGQYDTAYFTGRFVLTGYYRYGCDVDCDDRRKESDFTLRIVPDRALAARLPHWKEHHNDIEISIEHQGPFVRVMVPADKRAALISGKLDQVTGHTTIVVDHFKTGIECDSAYYSARFVAFAKPATMKLRSKGNYGCL